MAEPVDGTPLGVFFNIVVREIACCAEERPE